jgi:hypothetical protein
MHQIPRFAVRPGSLWHEASAGFLLCLRASVVKVGPRDWGRSPLQGSGLMGVPLTQAFSLGFVRSPLRGSRTTAELARLSFVRGTLRFPLKRGTKAIVARS